MRGLVSVRINARLTHADDPLDVNAANIDFLGELVDGLIGVLVGEWVHIDFDPCQMREEKEG